MRIFLPATSSMLSTLLETGELSEPPLTGFAVTPGLREWYVDDDLESLEYAALLDAARGSLRLIDSDPAAARRRVVLAVEIDAASVDVRDDLDRGIVRITTAIPIAAVASAHVDDAAAEGAVAAAANAMIAADLGDEASQDIVDDAEGHELSWYANQELAAWLTLL